jgi:PAS domain S-box-containing protein
MERGELEVARAPSRAPWGFLAQAVSLLAASLDLETTLANVVQLAVPALADWCGIDLIQPDGSMRPIAGVHSDPQRQRLLDELQRRYGNQRIGTMARVHETGQAELRAEVTDEMLARSAQDAEHLDLLRAVGAQSYMVVPLRARGRVLGTMVLLSTDQARHYGEDDLVAAEELASGCALAVDNARLFTEARNAEKRKDEGLALLDGLFANAPVGVGFLDTQLRYVRINRKLAEINGRAIDDHLGQRVDAVVGGDLGAQIARDCRKVIESGEPLLNLEVVGDTVYPGHRRVWLANYYPVRMGVVGEVTGVGTVVQEITERKQVERRASFLAEASALMDQSLDTEVTLRNLGASVVPELADWFAVDLVGSDEGIHLAAVAHSDPARTALGWELARRFPAGLDDEAGFGRTIRTGCSELLPQIPDHVLDQVSGGRPEYAEILRGLGLTSTMIVPLRARGRIIGAMLLGAAESRRRFSASDLALAEELGVRCALALDNARLYHERSETARTLQSSLLPPGLPSIGGLELAARYRAAGEGNEVGGDFYDVFAWDEAWAVVIGDVCGKGPDAAAITALARYTVRAVTLHEHTPNATLRTLNDAMLRQLSGDQFCTVALGRVEPLEGGGFRVVISLGGHPGPLVLRASGRVEALAQQGTLLGIIDHPRLQDSEHVLEVGDTLLLYTDGVTEARVRSWELGEEGLVSLLAGCAGQAAAEIVETIERAVVGVQAGEPRDDIALLALQATVA